MKEKGGGRGCEKWRETLPRLDKKFFVGETAKNEIRRRVYIAGI